jgi:hypothetical protein
MLIYWRVIDLLCDGYGVLLCIDPEKPIAALFGDAGAIEAYLRGKARNGQEPREVGG